MSKLLGSYQSGVAPLLLINKKLPLFHRKAAVNVSKFTLFSVGRVFKSAVGDGRVSVFFEPLGVPTLQSGVARQLGGGQGKPVAVYAPCVGEALLAALA